MLGDPRQHARTDFVAIVKCKDVVRPTGALQNAM